jgi:hypothetical protein
MLSSAVGEETGGAWIVGCFFAMPHGREEMNKSLIHRQGSWSGKRAMVARPKERKKRPVVEAEMARGKGGWKSKETRRNG